MADKDNPGEDGSGAVGDEARSRPDIVERPDGARDESAHEPSRPPSPRRRLWWRRVVIATLMVGVAGGSAAWIMRKRIADDLIASQLHKMGLRARYTIKSIGPSEQVITGLVIGDPAHPDLTVRELRVDTRLWWGLPAIGRITLIDPRLYGTVHDGKPSFGALDKVLFTGSKAPFRMPDLDIAVRDGRALINADAGRVGLRVEGAGRLRGGFKGTLAAVTPGLSIDGCATGRLTAYGALSVADERPMFDGPVRWASAGCAARDVTIGRGAIQASIKLDRQFDGGDASLVLAAAASTYKGQEARRLDGKVRATLRGGQLTARYTLTADRLVTDAIRAGSFTLDGQGRGAANFSHFDAEGTVSGESILPGRVPARALAGLEAQGRGTLVAPLVAKLRKGLAREGRASRLRADMVLRLNDKGYSLVLPTGALTGSSGQKVLALSRVLVADGPAPDNGTESAAKGGAVKGSGAVFPRMSGNFITAGQDMPRLNGRMEAGRDGHLGLQVSMADYRAGKAMVALPRLSMHQDANGAIRFGGTARIGGALPGGEATNLTLPLDGRITPTGDVRLWPSCTRIAFDGLTLANLTLDGRSLEVCPATGSAIVRREHATWHLAAGVSALDLTGHLGETPVHAKSGPVGFAWPGLLKAQDLRIALGPESEASQFHIADLEARLGAHDEEGVTGRFENADVSLAAVPLDLRGTSGTWRFADGRLTLGNVAFQLRDREKLARFEPLQGTDGTLTLADSQISAAANLLEPQSHRLVTRIAIAHDLRDFSGHADLVVPGIVFGPRLQASQLSALALGVVSDLKGTVTGQGRIGWSAAGITSRGTFSSEGLDFAAAFGPVTGLSGTIHFTDLLGLVTALRQQVHIAGINPGIAVSDGVLTYRIAPGHVLHVDGARWPFMDGTLQLLPTTMRLGVAETRHYTLKVTGLNAATFVQNLQVGNINATGVFDGEVPMVFDQDGGRIDGGVLRSRSPGGSVAYLGALTYKDLGTMGNFAFQALRSVKYKSMEIDLGGSLSGDILTRIRFDGLSQGDGAAKNFLTRRIAKLPIRFIVNIKAPFFSLFGSVRSLYDPSYVTDPRTLGLIDASGAALPTRSAKTQNPSVNSSSGAVSGIQPSDSEKRP